MGFTTRATARVVGTIALTTNDEVVAAEARSRLDGGRVGSVTDDDSVSVKEDGASNGVSSYYEAVRALFSQHKRLFID